MNRSKSNKPSPLHFLLKEPNSKRPTQTEVRIEENSKKPSMEILPDDVWHRILETGTETGRLDHKDLCSLSMSCHHFDELAQDSALWATLFDRDFYCYSDETPSKALYKEEFQLGINDKHRSFWRWRSLASLRFTPLPPRPRFSIVYCRPLHLEPLPNYHAPWYLLGATDDHLINDNGEDAIGQSSRSRSTHVPYVKDKFSKKLPKVLRPKVKPNSKSYIPMNRPPRKAMARKN